MRGGGVVAALERVRQESDALYRVIAVIASSPDLDRVLEAVVAALTDATRCHACFVYLRSGDRLRMRAASRIYAQFVGEVEFGADQGLAGWALQRNTPAFIRENAMADPRTYHVPELEEERFQSMVAIPMLNRRGDALGVIVLHTIAPREFDEQTLNLLAHVAPLVAGAIENAQLYEDARRRVEELTALSALSQRIAGVDSRAELYAAATEGARELLGCEGARLYSLNGDSRLVLVAADPPVDQPASPGASGAVILLELVQRRELDDDASRRLRAALGLEGREGHVLVVPVAAGGEHLGALVALGQAPWAKDAEEIARAVANQVAVAMKKAELIERLTEENVLRDLFAALEGGRTTDAEALARKARCDLDRAHVFVTIGPVGEDAHLRHRRAWPEVADQLDMGIRRLAPGAVCETGGERLRALLPLASGSVQSELRTLDARLAELGVAHDAAIGRSAPRRGAGQAREGLREAADAARVAAAILDGGGALPYRDLGAYRYLVHVAEQEAPQDPYLEAVRAVADYDRRRRSNLVATLEEYLRHRRRVTETARALTVHPNTLRQRLERIEALTGVDLAGADLLALELAIKLTRLKPHARS